MTEEQPHTVFSVLIVDDEEQLVKSLQDALRRLSEKGSALFEGLAKPKSVAFETDWCAEPKDILKYCGGVPTWDFFVIDRMFGGEDCASDLLLSLGNLPVQGLRIVWTAYADPRNAVECMRLGAWDYIDKNKPVHGDPITDVIVSVLDSLKDREARLRRAEIEREGHQFVADHYEQIYDAHKESFVAIGKDESGDWSPVADDPSLFGLYQRLKSAGYELDEVHITLIHE